MILIGTMRRRIQYCPSLSAWAGGWCGPGLAAAEPGLALWLAGAVYCGCALKALVQPGEHCDSKLQELAVYQDFVGQRLLVLVCTSACVCGVCVGPKEVWFTHVFQG